jgi:hypothetical protein
MPGPVPKRSDQRLGHRSKADKASVTKLRADGQKRGPDLPDDHGLGPLAVRVYESLRTAPQAQFFEDTDWSLAQVLASAVDRFVATGQAAILREAMALSARLAMAEGDRRRFRLELQRIAHDEVERHTEIRSSLDAFVERQGGWPTAS